VIPAPVHELIVVMPVYNEEASLAACVLSWREVLDGLGLDYEVVVLDDGSSDGTAAVLASLSDGPRVRAVSKANEGHGPTILRGYRDAAERAEWIFQVDSDDEIPADVFGLLWDVRAGNDAVFGVRTDREQPIDRRAISKVAALTSRVLFRSRARDVNVPYRLLRSSALAPLLTAIPPDTFAPNIVISGVLGRDTSRFAEVPVPHHPRRAGQVSIAGLGAVRAAARSFVQTVRLARRV